MIDPRGPRVAAWLTTVVLAVVLLRGSAALLSFQAVVFALGTRGASPYEVLYRVFVQPRLGAPRALEPAAPVRFGQLVGLVLATAGTLGYLYFPAAGTAATAAALAAAVLHAAVGLCLGCELYLLFRRTTTGKGATA